MARKVTFRQANPGWAKNLVKRATGLGGKEAAGGFPRGSSAGSQTYDNGASVLDVAIWNQFGTDRIPARPFIDNAVTRIEQDKSGSGAHIAKQVLDGEITAEQALKKIGQVAETAIREAITDDVYEPNAPSTIRRKRSNKPLIHTGKMRQAVTSVVRDRSS